MKEESTFLHSAQEGSEVPSSLGSRTFYDAANNKKSLRQQAKLLKLFLLFVAVLFLCFFKFDSATTKAQSVAPNATPSVGDHPILEVHINQADIETGSIKFKKLLDIGEFIFAARWNKIDGQGRPAATGNGAPTKRDPSHDPGFIRTSGTDSTSCADCHNQPFVGGAGGFVAIVFVLAQVLDPVIDTVSADFSDERNTLGMNGSGAIEMHRRRSAFHP